MNYNTEKILGLLIDGVSEIKEVESIGISGSKIEIPKAGEGDIDVFIYCDEIPKLEKRKAAVDKLGNLLQERKFNVFEGGHWGTGDFVLINGIETWLMYFTIDETIQNTNLILSGEYLDKLDNYYYPIGRCAMLKNITILYDRNKFLASLKEKLFDYPEELAQKLVQYHLEELSDVEDLERAVARKDVLFYHFALELAIDHFLQALFAMNKIYFPSRKRTISFIKNFRVKPEDCEDKLLEVVRLGACADNINKSYELWAILINEIVTLKY
ncbi:DUF4037 domain-containing protein [Clostridium sp. YIM B02515]|uniref:DUF4037 domain-containing protein n=1 Tax=Clostridium rhizosphaerae TaxID=2803861 RepID=A0ABS1TC84_9CLOT|nr:DUF4037 domain-containing protein [Clostridium rhizosphaerae]MBL4936960.1 DUF4037 domain-containing protein [Clostridium rhizosphaerae]